MPTQAYVEGVLTRLTEAQRIASISRFGWSVPVVRDPLRIDRPPLPSESCAWCGSRRGATRSCEGCGAS